VQVPDAEAVFSDGESPGRNPNCTSLIGNFSSGSPLTTCSSIEVVVPSIFTSVKTMTSIMMLKTNVPKISLDIKLWYTANVHI
jgi:hypothetical protein